MRTKAARAEGGVGVQDGEHEMFVALFFGHATRLVRLSALLGAEDPEDVVQESFCRLYAARGRLDADDARVLAYLNRIVVNEVRSRHRRREAARQASLQVVKTPSAVDLGDSYADRSALVGALARLPERKREALVLRFWLDLPLAEIAAAMNVRVGTVKSLLSRGLDALAADLGIER